MSAILSSSAPRVPRCGAAKKRSKYGSPLCQSQVAKLPQGGYAPRCARHLSAAQKQRFGLAGTVEKPGGQPAG